MRSGVLALLVASVPALAQQQPPAPPVFPSGVEVVAVDVGVVDATGRPVPDLAPGDFELTVDGRPRRVVSAEFISQGEAPPEAPPPPSHFSSNERTSPGRLVLIVVDQGNIPVGGGAEVVAAAGRLLDKLRPEDRVGFLTLPGPEPRQEFTSDHQRVRDVLQQVRGRGRFASRRVSLAEALAYDEQDDLERWAAVVFRECRAAVADVGTAEAQCVRDLEAEASRVAWDYRDQSRRSLGTLESVFEALQRVEGQKVMVLVSQGLGLPEAGSRRGRVTPDVRALGVAAAAARVSLFVVQVRQSPGSDVDTDLRSDVTEDDRLLHADGLETLAVLARGAVFRGDPGLAFDRVAREVSGYYVLGFEPEGKDRDGKAHEIAVRLRRPGLTVRARRAVALPGSASPKDEVKTLVASLRAPVAATGIPVRVATYAVRDAAPGKVRLLISAEIGRQSPPRGLTVAWMLLDGRGRVAASAVQRASDEAEAASGPVPFTATANVAPGLYTLKLAVRDRAGRQGSVEHPVKAALVTAGPLELSDLLLGRPPERGDGLRPGLGLEMSAGTPLLAHLELYGDPGALAVAIEVAHGPDAPTLFTQAARIAQLGGRRVAQALIPVGGLAPGDYVARAVVRVKGQPAAGATHAFRITAN